MSAPSGQGHNRSLFTAEIEQLQNEKVAREETEQRLRSTFEAERDNAIQKAKADIEQRTREALQTESETAIQKAKTEAEQELGRVFEILKTEKDIRESLEAQFGRSLAEVIRETRTQTREELAKTHADALRKQERDLRQEYSARYARAFQKRKQVNERIRELLNEETLEQEAAAPRVQQRLLASRGSEDLTDQDQREHTELQVPRGSDTLRAHLQGLTEGSQFGEQLENGDEGWQAHQQRGSRQLQEPSRSFNPPLASIQAPGTLGDRRISFSTHQLIQEMEQTPPTRLGSAQQYRQSPGAQRRRAGGSCLRLPVVRVPRERGDGHG